ncbi:C4-dicarboxylate ABC transporter [Paractinoplanes deccanensis]|uniref:C4-dicarboxylate ABC transporter n=1 Tax=Paractinoplanes deccanensis TaxID=113561 RepID=A0ABQ3YAK7_9ACTN|nr:TDT family transporter [Actinoplanes deccanensis]GID76960.1 C4-dicarboxylate ABC transporter [Actinoplanes deccanensis]
MSLPTTTAPATSGPATTSAANRRLASAHDAADGMARPTGFLPSEAEHLAGGAGRLGPVLAAFGPNWFASVMGTGIVATAATSLPVHVPGLRFVGVAFWGLAVTLLAGVTAATVLHWRRHFGTARRHHLDPVMAHFYGAPPMALLTVGAATLLAGRDVIGEPAAVTVDWVLWTAGTIGGLITAVAVPYLQFTRHDGDERSPFGGWLMPLVPPMVSASTGALLVPHTPEGQLRLTLLVACYAMFGLSLIASFAVIPQIWHRLATHKIGPARMVPTLWIVLGPLGQSITAINLLGGVAALALPPSYAGPLHALGVVFGVPVWGFALLWAALALAITVRTAREHLPFSLTWWSFTFPVGTCVTGTSALAAHTGSEMLAGASALLYAALIAAWAVVATRTARGVLRGTLALPSPSSPR